MLTWRLTTMTGMLRTQTRTRIQIRGKNFRKVPEMLSTIAFCRLSMADSLIVADSTATTTMIHTCMQRHQRPHKRLRAGLIGGIDVSSSN